MGIPSIRSVTSSRTQIHPGLVSYFVIRTQPEIEDRVAPSTEHRLPTTPAASPGAAGASGGARQLTGPKGTRIRNRVTGNPPSALVHHKERGRLWPWFS